MMTRKERIRENLELKKSRLKRCGECEKVLSLEDDFSWSNKKRGLKRSDCKMCLREAQRERRKDPVYREAQREAQQERRKDPAYREAEREAEREAYREDPEPKRKTHRKWQIANPDKVCAIMAKRRLKKLNQHDPTTDQTNVQAIYKLVADMNKAAGLVCGDSDYWTVDHWICVDIGGSDHESNLVPMGASFNSRKYNKPPEQWVQEILGPICGLRVQLKQRGCLIPFPKNLTDN